MAGKIFNAMMKEKIFVQKRYVCFPLYFKHDGIT